MNNHPSEYEEAILNTIRSYEAIKYADLALKVMEIVNPLMYNQDTFQAALMSLIMSSSVVEITYVVNGHPHFLYFPRDTRFGIGE